MSTRSIVMLLVILTALGCASVASLLFLRKLERDYLGDLEHTLSITAQTLALNLAPVLARSPLPEDTVERLQETLRQLQNGSGSRIRLFTREGDTVIDSMGLPLLSERRALRARPEVGIAFGGRYGAHTRFADEAPHSLALYVAVPSVMDGQVVGVVYVSHNTDEIVTRLGRIREPIRLTIISLAGLITILGTGFALTVKSSLDRVRTASSRMVLGDLGERVEVRGFDEMADIAAHFNRMASSLQQKVSELEGERDKTKRFIQDLTHELKTPLTGLSGSVHALLDGAEDDACQRHLFISNLKRDSDRLARLVSRILQMQKLEYDELKSVKFDMLSLAERVAAAFEAEAARRQVTLLASGDDVQVAADPDKIERVLENLVENALRYSPDGGSITITSSRSTEGVRVEVTDQGAGIEPAIQARVFERFYRGENAGAGTLGGAGLGLSIASEIIHRHGGQIGVSSEPGHGARFFFTLP